MTRPLRRAGFFIIYIMYNKYKPTDEWIEEHAFFDYEPLPKLTHQQVGLPSEYYFPEDFTGKNHTPKTKKKISEAQKIYKIGNKNASGKHKFTKSSLDKCRKTGTNNGRATKIQVDGLVYSTIAEAVEKSSYSYWQLRDSEKFPRLK